MQASITHKVQNGKLLRMELEFDTTRLRTIKICGDFFIHPEETVLEWEKTLEKIPVESTPDRIQQKLETIVKKNNSQLIGINTEIISKLISEAIKQ